MIKFRVAILIFFLVALGLPGRALATVMVGETVESGGVIINYTYNHDYYPRDWPYRYQMLADAVDQLRREIYQNLKMPMIMVVIPDQVFGRVPENNSIEFKKNCLVERGDIGGPRLSEERGFECYEVSLNTQSPSWEGMVKAIMSLTDFDRSKPLVQERLEDLASDQAGWYERLVGGGVTKFKNYYNLGWSPDSRYVSALFWQDGTYGVEVIDREENIVGRIVSPQPPAHAPVWIDDGKYLVYTTMDEVLWWDLDTKQIRNIPFEASNLEVQLAYDASTGYLNLAADSSVLADYVIYRIDLASGQISELPFRHGSLGWDSDEGVKRMIFSPKAVSPDGLGVVTYENKWGKEDDILKFETEKELPIIENRTDISKPVDMKSGEPWPIYIFFGLVSAGAGFISGFKVAVNKLKRQAEKFPTN